MSEKKQVFLDEKEKLKELFENATDNKKQLIDGLIKDAAFLFAQNQELRSQMESTGMVRIDPNNPARQRKLPTAEQYLKNVNSYANVIKTLNGILSKIQVEEDDGMEEFE